MIPLDACQGDAARAAGPKAATLARLRAAGLPVPDGVVVLPGEVVDPQALDAALTAIAGPAPAGGAFAVRSSGAFEDVRGASAAGVFESLTGVRGLEAVLAAVFRVRASAAAEPARAYLQVRGIDEEPAMAVLIQPMVKSERLAVAHSRADGFLVEERAAGEPEWADVEARLYRRDDPSPLATGLRAIEALLGGPADVELARTGETITFLQARPLAPDARRAAAPDARFSVAGSWRRDAEHNPRPLSAAQASLVEHVDALGVGARQAVIGGYLYVSKAPPRGLSPIPLAELRRRFDEEVAPDCVQRLAASHSDDGPAVLAAFSHVYARTVGEVAPSLSRVRAQLDQFLRMNLGESLSAHGVLLSGLGGATLERDQALWSLGRGELSLDDYQQRFGMYAPAWDVAVPPDDEAPDRVRAVAERLAADPRSPMARHADAEVEAAAHAHALLERLDRMARRAWKALLPLARELAPIAEDDDQLFFSAQRAVRRALLHAGRRLVVEGAIDAPEDVFHLPLSSSFQAASSNLRAEVARARAALAAAEATLPPPAIDDGVPQATAPSAHTVLRGHATAGSARGTAFVLRDPARAPAALPAGAILVVPAILPSLTYLLPGARALVTDHGGATSHGATLAREYRVPAVLGTRTATALETGAELYVDGASGRVYVL